MAVKPHPSYIITIMSTIVAQSISHMVGLLEMHHRLIIEDEARRNPLLIESSGDGDRQGLPCEPKT